MESPWELGSSVSPSRYFYLHLFENCCNKLSRPRRLTAIYRKIAVISVKIYDPLEVKGIPLEVALSPVRAGEYPCLLGKLKKIEFSHLAPSKYSFLFRLKP